MQRLEVSGAVRHTYMSLGVEVLKTTAGLFKLAMCLFRIVKLII
jgi:hypothetical protein